MHFEALWDGGPAGWVLGLRGFQGLRISGPAALNPTPYLNPKPSTLNPQPSTLNPKPSTLSHRLHHAVVFFFRSCGSTA